MDIRRHVKTQKSSDLHYWTFLWDDVLTSEPGTEPRENQGSQDKEKEFARERGIFT